MTIFERVKKFNLPDGEYALFGSSLLEVWGLRKAQDLDIIATPRLFSELKVSGWKQVPANGFELLAKGDANISTVQNRPTDGGYMPDRMKLIKEAIIISGVPFVRIEEVIACKRDYGRKKDLSDIEMIQGYLKSHANPYELQL